jgi:CRP-like cAMP-binding protein
MRSKGFGDALEGQVSASVVRRAGTEVMLEIAGPGELVGELAALRGRARSATVRARTDVVALAVTGADFRRFLGSAPGAAVVVLDTVIER